MKTPRRTARWLAILAASTIVLLLLRDALDKAHVAFVFLLVVLGASADAGRRVGLLVTGLAFLVFNYLFLPPYYTLVIANPLDWLILVTFAITSAVAAQLLFRAQMNTALALARADEVDRLAALGAESLAAPTAADALTAIARVTQTALGADHVTVYEYDAKRSPSALQAVATTRSEQSSSNSTPLDAGQPTPTAWYGESVRTAVQLPDGTTRIDPETLIGLAVRRVDRRLDVRHQALGQLSVEFARDTEMTAARARFLDALAYYAALGLERVRLEASAEKAEAERRMESMRTALLMSVSHDLRTPLTTIKALAHELLSRNESAAARVISEESDRLDRMVGDLLDLSRIQSGALPTQPELNTVDELIGASLRRSHGALGDRAVAVTLPDAMLVARFDLAQSVRVLVNLLENAAKYSPSGSGIEIVARADGPDVCIDVVDHGKGVAVADAERIFEPFFRPHGTPPDVRGTGLGLSIARGLAEAQGGWLRYATARDGGAVFTFSIPGAGV